MAVCLPFHWDLLPNHQPHVDWTVWCPSETTFYIFPSCLCRVYLLFRGGLIRRNGWLRMGFQLCGTQGGAEVEGGAWQSCLFLWVLLSRKQGSYVLEHSPLPEWGLDCWPQHTQGRLDAQQGHSRPQQAQSGSWKRKETSKWLSSPYRTSRRGKRKLFDLEELITSSFLPKNQR